MTIVRVNHFYAPRVKAFSIHILQSPTALQLLGLVWNKGIENREIEKKHRNKIGVVLKQRKEKIKKITRKRCLKHRNS